MQCLEKSYLVSTWSSFAGPFSSLNGIMDVVPEVNCTVEGNSLAKFSRSLLQSSIKEHVRVIVLV